MCFTLEKRRSTSADMLGIENISLAFLVRETQPHAGTIRSSDHPDALELSLASSVLYIHPVEYMSDASYSSFCGPRVENPF